MSTLTVGFRQAERYYTATAVVLFGTAFQATHFTEHAVQFGMWIFGEKTVPWMSSLAMWLVHLLGEALVPNAVAKRQMMVGMEALHLIGNSIFLITLLSYYRLRATKTLRTATLIESFHLCEHLLLTVSVLALGKPLGMSTLFGFSTALLGTESAVGYRVSWHFLLNLIPTVLMVKSMTGRNSLGTAAR